MNGDRPVFLRWLLLNAVALAASGGTLWELAGRIHGASRFALPAIGLVYAAGAHQCGRAAWLADDGDFRTGAHLLDNVTLASWVAQVLGLLSTVAGFWIIFSGSSVDSLPNRISSGAGVALTGTFAGIFVSLVLTLGHRVVEAAHSGR